MADAPEDAGALVGGYGAEELGACWDWEGGGQHEGRARRRLEEDLVRDGGVLVSMPTTLILQCLSETFTIKGQRFRENTHRLANRRALCSHHGLKVERAAAGALV